MVFSRRISNRTSVIVVSLNSLEKYSNFVPKSDWQPSKQGPDLETFINSVESDIASHKTSKPKHVSLTKSERSALYNLQNREEIIIIKKKKKKKKKKTLTRVESCHGQRSLHLRG